MSDVDTGRLRVVSRPRTNGEMMHMASAAKVILDQLEMVRRPRSVKLEAVLAGQVMQDGKKLTTEEDWKKLPTPYEMHFRGATNASLVQYLNLSRNLKQISFSASEENEVKSTPADGTPLAYVVHKDTNVVTWGNPKIFLQETFSQAIPEEVTTDQQD